MNRGIYPILSGALAQEQRMQVLSNNLANVHTTAFKRDEPLFRSLLARVAAIPAGSGDGIVATLPRTSIAGSERIFAAMDGVKTDLDQGRLRQTGNELDLAIRGAGFFEVKTPQGILYTRDGGFHVDPKRRLVTEDGHPVMGQKGELKIPAGTLSINPRGGIYVNGEEIGTVKVVEFPKDVTPQKVGEGFFRASSPQPVKDVNLAVGHLEESGVNAVAEMVKLIEVMRSFESAQKLIQTMDGMMSLAIQEVGKVA